MTTRTMMAKRRHRRLLRRLLTSRGVAGGLLRCLRAQAHRIGADLRMEAGAGMTIPTAVVLPIPSRP